MTRASAPPPVLDGARVLSYAIVDSSVTYTGKISLIVRGRVLPPAKCLAIVQQMGDDNVLYFHCTSDWYELGAGFCASVEDAKAYLNRGYQGLDKKWVDVNVSEAAAREYIERVQHTACSFCGVVPGDDGYLEVGPTAAICDKCFEKTHALFEAEGLA